MHSIRFRIKSNWLISAIQTAEGWIQFCRVKVNNIRCFSSYFSSQEILIKWFDLQMHQIASRKTPLSAVRQDIDSEMFHKKQTLVHYNELFVVSSNCFHIEIE